MKGRVDHWESIPCPSSALHTRVVLPLHQHQSIPNPEVPLLHLTSLPTETIVIISHLKSSLTMQMSRYWHWGVISKCCYTTSYPNTSKQSRLSARLNQVLTIRKYEINRRQSGSYNRDVLHTHIVTLHIHPAISIAPLQVLYYSEALPTTARILYRSFTPKHTGNCR